MLKSTGNSVQFLGMFVRLLAVCVCCCCRFSSAKPVDEQGGLLYKQYGSVGQMFTVDSKHRDGYPGPFVRFLVAVNATDGPCVATVATPTLQPRIQYNASEAIRVGDCDKGPLEFDMQFPSKAGEKITVNLTFHSSVIEDASPPTCQISWSGQYLTPPPPLEISTESGRLPSLLPGCFTMDSREGWHMTYYWFYILEWGF